MNVEELISLVFDRKPLWDQSTKDYHNRNLTKKLWMEVFTELNQPYEIVKNKWRGIRDNFRKECAKSSKGRSGDDSSQIFNSKWAHFEALSFLRQTVSNRNTSGNIQSTSEETFHESTDYSEELPSDAINIGTPVSEERRAFKPPPHKKTKNSYIEKVMALAKDKMDLYKINSIQNNDPDRHFLVSLLPELKKISPHRRLNLKFDCKQCYWKSNKHLHHSGNFHQL